MQEIPCSEVITGQTHPASSLPETAATRGPETVGQPADTLSADQDWPQIAAQRPRLRGSGRIRRHVEGVGGGEGVCKERFRVIPD